MISVKIHGGKSTGPGDFNLLYIYIYILLYIYIYIHAKFFGFSSNIRLKFDGYHGT